MPDVGSLLGGLGVGGNIGKAIVQLELDTAKYSAEMKAAQAQTTTGTSSMGNAVSAFGGFAKAAFLGAGVAAVAGIGVAIKAGSDLNEQLNKSREVFGDASGAVIKFSEDTASSLGIAQAESLEAAGQFGQLFDAAGLASQAAAQMSTEVVELGADLGSFNNIPVAEALEKLRAGLSGEAEPLRVLGVFLNEARVEAEAYRSGIAELGEELTDGQKIQARYNIILEDTQKAQGDFGRTVGESLPNQLKVLKATLTDTAADIGQVLLPVLVDIAKFLNATLVPAIQGVQEGLRIVFSAETYTDVPVIGQLFKTLGVGVEEVGKIIDANFGPGSEPAPVLVPHSSEWIGHGINATGKNMASFTVDIDENTKAFIAHQKETRQAKKETLEFANMTGDAVKDWKNDVKQSLNTAILGLEDLTTESGITTRDVMDNFFRMRREARKTGDALLELSREKWVNDEFVKFISEQAPEWIIKFGELNEKQQRRAQELFRDTGKETKNVDDALDIMIGTLDRLDRGQSRHKVIIDYEYHGFDPSKPGMSGSQQVR